MHVTLVYIYLNRKLSIRCLKIKILSKLCVPGGYRSKSHQKWVSFKITSNHPPGTHSWKKITQLNNNQSGKSKYMF